MAEMSHTRAVARYQSKLGRNLAVILLLTAIIVLVTAAVTLWSGWSTQGTGAFSKVVFQQGEDNIATSWTTVTPITQLRCGFTM
jgi:hypothetical protein